MMGQNRQLRDAAKAAAAVLALCLGCAVPMAAQSTTPAQPADQQKPPAKPPAESNPFPDDTNKVPVLPSREGAAAPAPTYASAPPALPSDDADPVRSPDDPVPGTTSSSQWSDSASAVPMDRIQPQPGDETRKGRHNKRSDDLEPPVHQETAHEDESVGGLYLDQHNWKGALSRYESAVVLDPENPDVYWGLAEAQRHMGQFAAAKGNYQKVMEYDPGSKHAKEAKKLLQEPEMANAAAPRPQQP
ncbi:MAG TPA: tetratricopeptide repeat protein [Terracidiphilus sp.]|jgi:tetratricopeptide (TPR) repeat protein|nr:tetratricopeptide repeat protein [Terracidiphilus sp.]